MKKQLPYAVYLDKVYGAWLGKGVGGTLGAPYEGRKQQFEYAFDRRAVQVMLPNDDLADSFLANCPYSPGEYAYFKKNYARGIRPPESGRFNNRYYVNGMGCPIRSEVWACVAPGDPELAAELAGRDGVLDHAGDSVYAEQYLAAVESAAFFESDVVGLLKEYLPLLGADTRIRRLAEDALRWSEGASDWRAVRALILRDYGHPDCTNLYQNIGFTILCLVHGRADFIESEMIALNCGFDTDCSCATAGALLGIVSGGAALRAAYGIPDTPLKLTVDVTRRSDRLIDVAEDTCRVGVTLARHGRNRRTEIADVPPAVADVPVGRGDADALALGIDYRGDPVLSPGETKDVRLTVSNAADADADATLAVELPEGWTADWTETRARVPASSSAEVALRVTLPDTLPLVHEANRIGVTARSGDRPVRRESFGLNGAQVWRVWGPYWDNVVDIPHEELGRGYDHAFAAWQGDAFVDALRQYHLNVTVDPDRNYLAAEGDDAIRSEPELLPDGGGKLVSIREDLFSVADLVGFQGPCAVYAERRLYSPEDQEVCVQVGATDAYRLWVNGQEVSRSDRVDWWTAENRHHSGVKLRKGENRVVMKCVRRGETARFSVFFSRGITMADHVWDLGSYVPR